MVRWYNILLIVIAEYLAAIFVLNPDTAKLTILTDYKLHLIVLSSSLIIAAGYIINSFYDVERDLVNKPSTTVFDRIVSKDFSLNCYLFFNILALALSFYVSIPILIFNFLFIGALWFYSHKLHRLPFLAELSAAILSMTAFFAVTIYYQYLNSNIFFYGSFMLAASFIRELIKNVEAMKGDIVYGYKTTPVFIGIHKTKILSYIIMVLILMALFIAYPEISDKLIFYYFIIGTILILISAIMLYRAESKKEFQRINLIYKIILVAGVISLIIL